MRELSRAGAEDRVGEYQQDEGVGRLGAGCIVTVISEREEGVQNVNLDLVFEEMQYNNYRGGWGF